MRNLRRRLGALAAAVALSAGLAFGVTAAAATTTATSIPYPQCFGIHPAAGVQLPGHIAYECLGSGHPIANGGVGVYWSDNLYELNYYLHPASGEIVVDEVFLKSCGEVNLERHLKASAPCTNYGGLPTADTTPGQDKVANGRYIIMADGCFVAAPTDLGAAPTACSVVIQGGGASVSAGRPMNAVELASIKTFWADMNYYTPDHPYNYW